MKTLKITFAVLLLTLATGAFASTMDYGKKKKKHKCNTECTKEKHNYVCGEKKHKCSDKCHKM
jgi:hypothetical protein